MLGIAQQLYAERFGFPLWKRAKINTPSSWSFLEKMLAQKRLNYVDYALAQKFLSDHAPEAQAAFLCHLSLAARQGHLCVTIRPEGITPDPERVWLSAEEHSEDAENDFKVLRQLICAGITTHPSIIHKNDHFYLQRYWVLENAFVENLEILLAATTPTLTIDMEKVAAFVAKAQAQQHLLPEQASAVLLGCQSTLSIITGGPGTGKTHTAGILLKAFLEGLTPDQQSSCRMMLTAPTGKAAANLEASIRKALPDVYDFQIQSGTLHVLLGLGKMSERRGKKALLADLILIDECSMIDVNVMGQLFAAIKPGTRVIMLGDRFQLPPVEAGSLFSDLVVRLKEHVVELKKCMRAELTGIIELAEKVKQGDAEGALHVLHEGTLEGIKFVRIEEKETTKEFQRKLVALVVKHVPDSEDPQELIKKFAHFRLLTPMRKGPLGVETLNDLCYKAVLAKSRHLEMIAVPIMISKNDHQLGLFNGEVGILMKSLKGDKELEYALFAKRERVPGLLLPKYEYAYCLSVHKSQGSEFDHVVMVASKGSEVFGREALYTGVTRAKRALEVWSDEVTLRQMMLRTSHRHSGLNTK